MNAPADPLSLTSGLSRARPANFQRPLSSWRRLHRRTAGGILAGFAALALTVGAKAQSTFQTLRTFGDTSKSGAHPESSLIVGQDGALYGTTSNGGTNSYGTVFRVNRDGSGYQVLQAFAYTNGAGPSGVVAQGADGFLYGVTVGGDRLNNLSNAGTIFKVNTNGAGFQVVRYFNSFSANAPVDGLVRGPDGAFYGVASGYSGAYGSVYRFNADGSGYTNLHVFNGVGNEGRSPAGRLLLAGDGMLYGTTFNGGSNDVGTVFKINPTGANFVQIYEFSGTNGANPSTALIQGVDGFLYGTTYDGGTNGGYGTVFKLDTNGGSFQVLRHMGLEGYWIDAELVQGPDGSLFGTLEGGGLYGLGQAFRISTNGASYTVLHDFGKGVDGAYLYGGLVLADDGALYGVTSSGGPSGEGTIYKINPDGLNYAVVFNFNNTGGDPGATWAALAQGSDGALYGTSRYGGAYGYGSAFKVGTNGGNFSVLHDFGAGASDGTRPGTALVPGAAGEFYGVTTSGGSGTNGTIFRLTSSGAYSVLRHFPADGSEGKSPRGPLLRGMDGALYGTTYQGGSNGLGTIFKINTNGMGFTTLYSFVTNSGLGRNPNGALVQAGDGTLFGLTQFGASGNVSWPTAYRINADGSGYQVIHPFTVTDASGVRPDSSLLLAKDNLLYGVTYSGVLYKMNTNGAGFTTLHSFSTGNDGRNPYGPLMQGADGALYGTTPSGGTNNNGTVFKINTSGTIYTQIWFFNGASYAPAHPYGGVIQGADGALYGTTLNGGPQAVGAVYRLSGPLVPPLAITSHPASITNKAGTNVSFSVAATSTLTLGYQWQKNGADLMGGGNLSGVNTPTLTFNPLTPGDAGTYAVLVTNTLGGITSSNAFLRVALPPQFGGITRLTNLNVQVALTAGSNVLYAVEATTNFSDWTILTNLANPAGAIQYIDTKATNFPRRFYRARWSP